MFAEFTVTLCKVEIVDSESDNVCLQNPDFCALESEVR